MLEPFGFFKPHKSHLINSRFIVKYFKEGTIVLKDGSTVPLAKRKKHEFIQYINSKFE
jgi:two-component system LytT family response regulator